MGTPRSLDDLFEHQQTTAREQAAESAALRREVSRATQNLNRRLDAIAAEQGHDPSDALLKLGVKEVNKLVASKDFAVHIGPDSHTIADFDGKWTVMMRSSLMNDALKGGLAAASVDQINTHGEDIEPWTVSLFEEVVLHVAAKFEKGARHPSHLTRTSLEHSLALPPYHCALWQWSCSTARTPTTTTRKRPGMR